MTLGAFGKKIGMTQIFDEFGFTIPVTLIRIEPCKIIQIKRSLINGYNSIQLGYYKNLYKADLDSYVKKSSHFDETTSTSLNTRKTKIVSGEFSVLNTEKYNIGDSITIENFYAGQIVTISGKSKGKGFLGTIRRHNFSRGPMTHGSKNHRAPGSIGAGTTPGRVYPGKKMAGQTGNKKVTHKNIRILSINIKENILVLQGSFVGKPSTLVKIMPLN